MAVNVNLNNISSGYNVSQINENFDAIETALQDTLSRTGGAPNQMNADLDMNSNDILNANAINAEEVNVNVLRANDFGIVGDPPFLELIADAEAAATAAEASATEAAASAQQAEDTFITNLAEVVPSVHTFAVGGGVQSADTGIVAVTPASIRVFIDGVYQQIDTWTVADGVITPVGDTWPGDGVVENMEVIIDATTSVAYSAPADDSVTLQKLSQDVIDYIDDVGGEASDPKIFDSEFPFGRAGVRVLLGERWDAHYGLPSGWMIFPSGKWTLVYRRATSHGITDGAEIWLADSNDKGATLANFRLAYSNPLSDARPDMPRLFGNGRSGFMVNRQDVGSTHFSPLLIYSDDEFVTWNEKEITTTSPYTFQSNGGILDFPASQGGHDTLGFIAYGFASAGGYDAIHTSDNWETYSITHEVALVGTPSTGTTITALSEWAGGKVPGEDKWMFYLRCQDADGWRDEAACYVTTNMLNWGSPVPSNIDLGGNPPTVFVDTITNKYNLIGFGRGGRGIDGFDHHILIASADADELYAANGDWQALATPVTWDIVAPIPNWATGYGAAVQDPETDNWWMTFVCGEPGAAGGSRSVLAQIGDFTPTTVDDMVLQEVYRWNGMFKTLRAGFASTTSPPATANVSVGVDGSTAGFLSYNGGSTIRTHWTIRNTNGQIGSVSAGGLTTSYNETSHGPMKVDRVPLGEELDISFIIDSLEPLAYTWLNERGENTGERGYGLVAQDLYKVYPHAVTPGVGEMGDEDFVPWGVDYSKLVVVLLAEVKALKERLNTLEGRQ